MQFGSGLTEKTEEKPSNRLFLTDADIVPVNGPAQLNTLAYMWEAENLLPFFTPTFPLSSSTLSGFKQYSVGYYVLQLHQKDPEGRGFVYTGVSSK